MAMTTKPERAYESKLVGWCATCNCYDPDTTNGRCPGDCYTSEYGDRYRLLRPRRFIICSECTGWHLTLKDAEEHEAALRAACMEAE